MTWLSEPSFWWATFGALAQTAVIAVFVWALTVLWGTHRRPWGATLSFALYLLLFIAEPPPQTKAFLTGGRVEPEAALRSWTFVSTVALLLWRGLGGRR